MVIWWSTMNWLYKWLPRVFGCHTHVERSFQYRGVRFPICARCTGELLGIILASVSSPFWFLPPWLSIGLLIPLILDGTVQLIGPYESTNRRRLVTGVLFGVGFVQLFLASVQFVYHLGQQLALLR